MIWDILLTLLLVFLNGFFVAAEFAIVKIRASQLELKVREGDRVAKLSKHIVSNLNSYLAANQLGITLASLGLGWIGEPVVSKIILNTMHFFGADISTDLARNIALPFAFAIITILHIVLGEQGPKMIAIQRPQRTTMIIAFPLQLFYYLFMPAVWMLNGISNLLLKIIGIKTGHGSDVHSSEEIQFLVKQGQESGEIDDTEYRIIKNAFDFSEQTARQVMVPRTQIFAVDVRNFSQSVFDKIVEENFSRIPCYENNLDNIIGVVYLKDLLMESRRTESINIRKIMRTMLVVPETKRIGQLLNEFQAKHQHMALVVNEYGGTEGIITLEDIIEELVGEIQDESDNESPLVERMGEKTYNVLGNSEIDRLNEILPHSIPVSQNYDTIAGYLIEKFGKIPSVKEKTRDDNYEFCILKKNRTSITLVQLIDLSE